MTTKTKLKLKKEYNADNKNRIRQIIIDEIRKKDAESILTLESPEFIFSKLLPDKKIIVWENDGDVYTQLEKKCPKHVELVFGNIGKFGVFNSQVDVVFLDFCRTFMKEQGEIIRLKEVLSRCELFVLTVCMRTDGKNGKLKEVYQGDYQFDLIKRIQEITGINWKVVYGESYYDSVQMVTIIFENAP